MGLLSLFGVTFEYINRLARERIANPSWQVFLSSYSSADMKHLLNPTGQINVELQPVYSGLDATEEHGYFPLPLY